MTGLCGCCQPPVPLTPYAVDNLPGLTAIAYRIGSYASFRETMLESISRAPELAGLATRQDDDFSITLLDLSAAVFDVLTFYQERYANEFFLRTAKQPESLRRIARLVDYRLRPGVAALAQLAFTLDPGKTLQIPVGLKVQSVPAQNQQPQTFETTEAIAADARFNQLRIYPQPAVVNPLAAGSTQLILDRINGPAIAASLAVNDIVVLFDDTSAFIAEEKKIAAIRTEDDRIILTWTTPVAASTWNANTRVWKYRRIFRLFGYNAPERYMHPTNAASVPGGIRWSLLTSDYAYPQPNELNAHGVALLLYLDSKYGDIQANIRLLSADASGTIFTRVAVADQAADSFSNLQDSVTRLALDRVQFFTDRRTVAVYELVGEQLTFWPGAYQQPVNTAVLYLPGRCVHDAQGPGVEVGRTIQQNVFLPGVVIHPSDLTVGREVILTDGSGAAVQAKVHGPPVIEPATAIAGDFCHLVLSVDSGAFQLDPSTALLLGNVAQASHGETVSNESLGSGVASQQFQAFKLQKSPLTYVPHTSPDGLASSLQVTVNQNAWREVPALYGQPAASRVYSTFTAEDLHTVVQMGDGVMGALLPTGQANVEATYRVGAGLAGRVDVNSLTTILTRITNLTSATNPLPAEGGADPETTETARQNAPRTVRTFGRAVSLRDFEDLATASGEVAKASAEWTWNGFAPAVHLTVAVQQGGTFSADGLNRIGLSLNAARDPNHRLILENFVRVPIRVRATILPDPALSRDAVLAAAFSAVLQALSFDRLNLGQSIHLSNIFSVLQQAPGVLAADVTLLAFRRPIGITDIQFHAFLARRGVTFLAFGVEAPLQPHLRIFTANSDPSSSGRISPAEMAWVDSPATDIQITSQGS